MRERVREADCLVCGAPNPPRRRTCTDVCKKAAKRASDRARYLERRDETIARACAWQAANADHKQAYDAEYRERTRERRLVLKREQSREAYRANLTVARQRARLYQQARRARKAENDVRTVSARDLRRALHRARHRCVTCEQAFTPDNPLEWDHVVPVVRGGRHSIGNLAPFCRTCNRGKCHRFIVEWRARKVVPRALVA